jgi:Tfp pilus assembly protein PilX
MRNMVKEDQGTALIVAILFLLVLSILVAILNRSSVFEMMSSRQYQDSQNAFYSAEAGVRQGMSWLNNLGAAPENSLNMPAWFTSDVNSEPWSGFFIDGASQGYRYRYYVQHLKDASSTYAGGESAKIGTSTTAGNKVHFYRITSEGSNSSGSVIKQVQVVVTANY